MANTIIVAGAAAATLVILAYGVTHRSLRVSDPAGAVAIGLFVALLGVLGVFGGIANRSVSLAAVGVGLVALGCLVPLRSRFK